MSIRERTVQTLTYVSGGRTRQRLPTDAVFHALRLNVEGGTFSTAQGAMGTGPTLVPGFPFSLIQQVSIIRNGSDYFYSVTGEQLAKQHYYLNNSFPKARLYTTNANVETLRTATVRGVTVPATSEVLGQNLGGFSVPDAPASTGTVQFDMQADILFQIPNLDQYFATLVDGRPLSDFAIEIQWANVNDQIAVAGTANTSNSASFNVTVNSLDQDNVQENIDWGTFKRSQIVPAGIAYGSQNQQILLPKGNLLTELIFETKAFKAGSATVPVAENDVLGLINLRVNTQFQLKTLTFRQWQSNNVADNGGRQNAFALASGTPQGYCQIPLFNATQDLKEALPTFAFDTLDLQVSANALGSATNGATTGGSLPQVAVLVSEVIPGKTVSASAPQGAINGSTSRTSAKAFR